jgi:hypothetical protein
MIGTGAASKFYPEPDPRKNDEAPQCCESRTVGTGFLPDLYPQIFTRSRSRSDPIPNSQRDSFKRCSKYMQLWAQFFQN